MRGLLPLRPAPAPAAEAAAPAPQLELGETVLVGRPGHVATVERAPRAGDDEVLVRWESTGHCEDVALADVEKLSAGRSSRRSRVLHERGGGGLSLIHI